MISDFESRLADVLGTHIAAPFNGRVDVAPGETLSNVARVILGVTAAETMEPDIGSRRHEVVPGANVPRRAVRLRCTVSLEARSNPVSREEEMRALDAALYALDDQVFRNGSALSDGSDRGFVIQEMQPAAFDAPLAPSQASAVVLRLTATGLFWPIGVAGEAGRQIDEIHFRGGVLPIEVVPADPLLVAGGPPVELTIRFSTAGMLIRKDSVAKLPFGAIAITLVSAGGKPGKGTLTGGAAGTTEAIRLLPVTDDAATVTYTPPDTAHVEELIVAFEGAENALGIEIARVTLRTRSA